MGVYSMEQSRKKVWWRQRIARVLAVVLMFSMLLGVTSSPALAAAKPSLTRTSAYAKGSGDSIVVTVCNASSFSVSVNQSWLSYSRSGNRITVKVAANNTSGNRYGCLTVKVGSTELKCTIIQRARIVASLTYGGSGVSSVSFVGGKDSGVNQVPARKLFITASASITSTTSYSWIHVSVYGNAVTVSVDDNYSGYERRGSIGISDGVDQISLTVIQSTYGSLYGGYTPPELGNISNDLVSAFRPFKSPNAFIYNPVQYCIDLITATCNHYGVAMPGYAIGTQEELVQWLNLSAAEANAVAGLYAGYDKYNDLMIVNLSNAGTPELIAKAIFHELRHKWQNKCCKYNKGRREYLMRYGMDHYTNAGDMNQNVERDARDYADKLYNTLGTK